MKKIKNNSVERSARDIIDDIMVRLDLLENEISIVSRDSRYKGRIMNMYVHMENIRDLLIELKKKTSQD